MRLRTGPVNDPVRGHGAKGDTHNVLVDGTVMSPGSEDYNLSPASELVDQFRRFLGSQVQVSEGA
jgi:hypothetical protein